MDNKDTGLIEAGSFAYEQCTKVGCSKCRILCQNAPVPPSHELVISKVAAFVAFEQTDRRNHTEFNTWAR